MGLDTSHDAWHGAYSAFSRWRTALADAAGYTSHETKHGFTVTDVDWANIQATIGDDLLGVWPRVPVRPDGTPDALIVLIAHSDCEGQIQVDMLEPLAVRLEELLPKLSGDYGGHIGDIQQKTQTFINGLRAAAAANKPLEFH